MVLFSFPYCTSITESSPPLNIRAMNVSVVKIRLSWDAPETSNGVIIAYRVSLNMGMQRLIQDCQLLVLQEREIDVFQYHSPCTL